MSVLTKQLLSIYDNRHYSNSYCLGKENAELDTILANVASKRQFHDGYKSTNLTQANLLQKIPTQFSSEIFLKLVNPNLDLKLNRPQVLQ